jgi:uncharacterized damage-inducible protein DinB
MAPKVTRSPRAQRTSQRMRDLRRPMMPPAHADQPLPRDGYDLIAIGGRWWRLYGGSGIRTNGGRSLSGFWGGVAPYPAQINDGAMLIAARHNCWANLQLVEFCAKLATEQLAWTAPGTYGTIHATLQHIIESEQDYLSMLSRGEFTPELGRVAALDELRTLARSNAEKVERVFAAINLDRALNLEDGVTVTGRVIAAQFIHHGSDHRSHLGTILGSRGVQPPRLDAWAYGRSIGELKDPA